jgi:hypothetical protein
LNDFLPQAIGTLGGRCPQERKLTVPRVQLCLELRRLSAFIIGRAAERSRIRIRPRSFVRDFGGLCGQDSHFGIPFGDRRQQCFDLQFMPHVRVAECGVVRVQPCELRSQFMQLCI